MDSHRPGLSQKLFQLVWQNDFGAKFPQAQYGRKKLLQSDHNKDYSTMLACQHHRKPHKEETRASPNLQNDFDDNFKLIDIDRIRHYSIISGLQRRAMPQQEENRVF